MDNFNQGRVAAFWYLFFESDNNDTELFVNLHKYVISNRLYNAYLQVLIQIRDSYFRIHNDHNEWLERYTELQFYQLYRVNFGTFGKLLEVIMKNDHHNLIKKKIQGGNAPVQPEKALLVFLWYMSNQETLNSIGDKFGLVPSTVMVIVNSVLYILVSLKKEYISWPQTPEEFADIANGFRNYPGTIGAVDGTHIFLKVPNNQHDSYTDRYLRCSINLMAICTSQTIFTYVFVGFPGSAHDSRVFSNSRLVQNLEQGGLQKYFLNTELYHLIGDSAFPLRMWLMTPYRQNHALTRIERNHNYHLSCDRIKIEHAFGLLKGRWRRLQFINCYSVSKAIEIVTAACVLHNFCLQNTDQWDEVYEDGVAYDEVYDDADFGAQFLGRRKRNRIATELYQR